jgi:cell division protein FtsB
VAWPFVASLVVVGVLFLFVFPGRTYLDQRRSLAAAHARLRVLGTESAVLEQKAARLHDDREIERLAREQYGLVKPGEEAYAILPPPTLAPAPRPPAKPHHHPGLLRRLWPF